MLGETLGAYRVESELGSGGMGKVFLAEAVERCAVPEGTRVALKVVHPHLLSEPGFFKRFLREAEIGKAVAHPNVVRCFDCDQLIVDGTTHAFLVMEYVEGQTLRDLLDELETVPEELCRHIGREVSKGLAAIHEAGVVHRDLKPENVLITPDHEVKVMDLGVARLADEAIRLSRTGAFVGSVLYASPEHFKGGGEDLDGRADLFALGVILYELSCGAHPHPGDDFASVLAKVVEETPRRLGECNPQLSAFFEEVVHALLAKDRVERFVSGAKLLEVLEQGEKSTWWDQRARTLRAETKRPIRRIRIPRETAVYGREEELAKLRALYAKTKSGDGQVVLIEGEAGIGKTRLVDELIGRLQQDGEDLNFLFGSYPPGGAATAAGAWATAYREQFGAEGLEKTLKSYLTVTPVLVPAFAALLRGEPPPDGKEPLTKDSIQTVFVHATRAIAQERTTVVLIEDLHFAPEEGRAMFASLALTVPETRILLVGTARPGIPEDWRANLERLEQAGRMELSRLGPRDSARLLEDAFQSERLADELGMRIARKSDGNPFFVFEILRGLREGQFIARRPDGAWESTQIIHEIQIPSSVQDLIQARIAGLSEEEQELLDVAACCGFEFDPGLVAEAMGLSAVPALRRLGHLEKSHRLVRSAGDEFVFDHHQVQEALYVGISPPLRKRYHMAIGDALAARHPEPEGAAAVELCEHFLKGAQGERADCCLDAALDHLEAGFLNDRAIALADRALGAPGLLVGERRLEILLRKNGRLNLQGRRGIQKEVLEEARALAEASCDPGLRAEVIRAEGVLLYYLSRYEEARTHHEQYLALAREIGNRRGEAKGSGSLGNVLMALDRCEEARTHYEQCLAIAREIGDRLREAKAIGGLGRVFMSLGRYDEAQVHLEQYLALVREIGDLKREGEATGNLGSMFMSLGRYEEALAHHERSFAITREIGERRGEGITLGNLGRVLKFFGRYEEARTHSEQQLAIGREVGDLPGQASATGNLGDVFMSLGRYEEALAQLEQCLAFNRKIGDRFGEAVALVNLGILRLALGDLVRARSELEESNLICLTIDARHVEGYTQLTLGALAYEESDGERALDLAIRALALLRAVRHEVSVADSLLKLGELHGQAGNQDGSGAALKEAVGLLGKQRRKGELAHARALLALLPDGDVAAAEAALAEAGESGNTPAVRYILWEATGKLEHLAEAKRLLDFRVEHAPENNRKTMIENVTRHRDIVAAWEEHGEGK